MLYSIIIPVYNRPDEIRELLFSLTTQTYKNFEVLIIEDGSETDCKDVAEQFSQDLNIRYFFKENSGQGFSRNFGFERAKGDYFIVFDSDCIVPENYLEVVNQYLANNPADCWGGPDWAHPSFTPLQKAINFSMTSVLTTGGIRGGKNRIGEFHPRSFNMGISREVYEKTGGYKITRMGEDLEFSIRIIRSGFKTTLINDACVYHKRRTNLTQFFRQLHFFGRARVNISRFYPDEITAVHLFPTVFVAGFVTSVIFSAAGFLFFKALLSLYFVYGIILFLAALYREKNLMVAILSVAASYTQLSAYGIGFLSEYWVKISNGKMKNQIK
ncbi:MAG: glycosyltransferase [Balneolaceae bacterium]|nr:MAG: glycosyltransferase [Balneolaceae bacterium]